MTTGLRWTAEEVDEFKKRQERWAAEGRLTVRTHVSEDPNPCKVAAPPAELKAAPGKRVKNRTHKPRSEIEELLNSQLRIEHLASNLPLFVREHKAIAGRRFRLDFACPDLKIGVEVQGMVHRIRERFDADVEKRALHLLAGWRVLEVSGESIKDGRAIAWLKELIGGNK